MPRFEKRTAELRRRALENGEHRVPFAQARRGRVLQLALALQPAVRRDDPDGLLVLDEGLGVVLGLVGGRGHLRPSLLLFEQPAQLDQLALDHAPELRLRLQDRLDPGRLGPLFAPAPARIASISRRASL